VDEVNDLGVVIDSRLTFHTHIRKNIVRASIRANLIHKCFISRDVFILIRAFKVYVRPTLEYALCTWSPHCKSLPNIKLCLIVKLVVIYLNVSLCYEYFNYILYGSL